MILTNCAACAAPLAHDAPRCVRCQTRYCSSTCRHDHWRGWRGHEQICEDIHRGGGAEQYHADKKYKEAVAVAVKKCAADTTGQRCYICFEGDTEEGLVRGCSCRGASGVAHVSCLARQAKILVAEAENNSGTSQWHRWHTCSLCEQSYHGVVYCALGWACWKTYLGRPEEDGDRRCAMNLLGNGLHAGGHRKETLAVEEANLSILLRLGASEHSILVTRSNLAETYALLGRFEEALSLRRDLYSEYVRVYGEEHRYTLVEAYNLPYLLLQRWRFKEAKALLRRTLPVARRVLGENHEATLRMRTTYAMALCQYIGATPDDFREAMTTLEETTRTARRVLGAAHPTTRVIQWCLFLSRIDLCARILLLGTLVFTVAAAAWFW